MSNSGALMNAAGDRLIAIAGPRAGGFPFYDLDWDLALSLAENLTRFPGGQSSLSFLDARLMARCLLRPAERDALARHLVLPSGGLFSALLFRMMVGRSVTRRFSAARFVAALLTYADLPLRVAILDEDPRRAARLRNRLQQHAPWHDVVVASGEATAHCHVLIATGRPAAVRNAPVANLTIFAGESLA